MQCARGEPVTAPTESSPKVPSIRELLLDTAWKRLRRSGFDSLQARAITGEIGVSTTALYTHFGSMAGLISAVSDRAFEAFAEAIADPGVTDDPLADMVAMGLAYRNYAIQFPYDYELLFNQHIVRYSRGVRAAIDLPTAGGAVPPGTLAFGMVVERVQAMMAADLVDVSDAGLVSAQMWAALHGYVTLEIAGHFRPEPDHLVFGGLFAAILKGFGAQEEAIVTALMSSSDRVPLNPRTPKRVSA